MQFDKQIRIAAANSRFGPWQNQILSLSEFYARLAAPARSTEIRAAYLALKKSDQDRLKDVGGFVGGVLNDGVRKNGHITERGLVTLDIDKVEAGGTARILAAVNALGCGYAVYSTRKHAPEAPRLRVVVPLLAPLSAEEYEPCARMLARYIDTTMQCFDRTTFEPARLMYWPSCCADAEFVFHSEDRPFLDGRAVLAQMGDWREMRRWPYCPDETATEQRTAAKQADPETKEGIVGAFCRVYDIRGALAQFLPDVYIPLDGSEDRYTYAQGSTAGGAVLYENGKFLFSHHATDPAGGHLCNAFDLVRLHRFGELDDTAKIGTPPNKLPSYAAMCRFAGEDAAVARQLNADSEARAREAFGDILAAQTENAQQAPASPADSVSAGAGNLPDESAAAAGGLQFRIRRGDSGKPAATIDNAWAILETDPLLKGRIVLDVFQGRGNARGPYPWNAAPGTRMWTDKDDYGAQWYLEKIYDYSQKNNVLAALALCGQYHAVDPVRTYLNGLVWDGVPRLDTLFVDYLGAQDTAYTRTVTRKALCAAVARTYQPGVKFDCMTILTGPTGIGKSTMLRRLGKSWFSDSLQSFEGKEAREQIQGVWIVEIGELGYMNKTENNQVKQFLSQQSDIYRAAYGRNTEDHPRRCVFFGTSNDYDYLKDHTGNRRFWPLDVGVVPHSRSYVDFSDAQVDQVWAEAVTRYRFGETLYLSGEVEKMALDVQDAHTEQSAAAGIIEQYLDEQVPANWADMDADQVRAWNSMTKQTAAADDAKLIQRPWVCAAEVWEQVYHASIARMQQRDVREINAAIEHAGHWEKKTIRTKLYGVQRGFIRK